jgi:hypothetical protein
METSCAIPASTTQLSESHFISPEEIAAFLDGRVTGEERARLEAYFAENPEARRELVDASRIIASMPTRPKRRMSFAPIAGIAAAAAIAIVFLKPQVAERPASPVTAERRGTSTERIAAINLVTPANGADIGNTRVLVWRGVEGASYRLVVLDAAGETILQESTTDTVRSIPAALLKATTHYYWNVDAQMPDGSSITSGMHEFVVKEK